jgi:DNA-directed RNA polymerase subunit K
MLEKLEGKFTRYEIARILGARSLQLAMDAPILIKLSTEELEDLHFDTLKIAEKELTDEVLPITVRRPMPKKSEKTIKKLSSEEIEEKLEKLAEKEGEILEQKGKISEEKEEEKIEAEIKEEGEIMEMATPEDEIEDEGNDKPNEIQ